MLSLDVPFDCRFKLWVIIILNFDGKVNVLTILKLSGRDYRCYNVTHWVDGY